MHCGAPPSLDNTVQDATTGEFYTDTTTYSCVEGYAVNVTHPDGESITLECTEHGTWSVPSTQCGGMESLVEYIFSKQSGNNSLTRAPSRAHTSAHQCTLCWNIMSLCIKSFRLLHSFVHSLSRGMHSTKFPQS